MQAIILSGGENLLDFPVKENGGLPKGCLPVVNRFLIDYQIAFLKDNMVTDVILCLVKQHGELLEDYMEKTKNGLGILYSYEHYPRGTAGCVKDVRDMLKKDEPFLVMGGNLFLDADLKPMIQFHKRKKAMLTIGLVTSRHVQRFAEGVTLSDSGEVENITLFHPSRDRRLGLRTSGVYLMDPAVLRHIEADGYFDIKEQLIPILKQEVGGVYAYHLQGECLAVNNIHGYYNLNREILYRHGEKIKQRQLITGVWVGKNTRISEDTCIIGPVVIGDNCKIESGAQIIGPTVIGHRCSIKEDTMVRESILLNDVSLSKCVKVEYSIVGNNTEIPKKKYFTGKIILKDKIENGDFNLLSHFKIDGLVRPTFGLLIQKLNWLSYRVGKRTLDLAGSLLGLVIFSPLFLIISLIIKWDTPGPVFYSQWRCGKDGKEFRMLKFRTMITNAENTHETLKKYNESDGPMFKMTNDPRITRVGNVLRKTSLDELPQFLNVLKGDMSLVGPRPLIMEEMKFNASWRLFRLQVKPGITGLWQIGGRSDAPFHEWINYDIRYIKSQSLWLDIKIILKTAVSVIRKVGAK